MLRIEADGTEVTIARASGLLSSDEIEAAIGGRWGVVGNVTGFKILALVAARWQTHEQNMRASLLVGRMVFGPVLLCEVGNEIR